MRIVLIFCLTIMVQLKAQDQKEVQFQQPIMISAPHGSPQAQGSGPPSSKKVAAPQINVESHVKNRTPQPSDSPPHSSPHSSPKSSTSTRRKFFPTRDSAISFGIVYDKRPNIQWKNEKKLLIEGAPNNFFRNRQKYKEIAGFSLEYFRFFQDSFMSIGTDIWTKSKGRKDPESSISPMSFYINGGLIHSLPNDLFYFRMFIGAGIGKIGYNSDNIGVDLYEYFGQFYQVGVGVVFLKYFLDLRVSRIKTYYSENGHIIRSDSNSDLEYRRKGKISLDIPIVRFGLFF